MPVIPLFKLGQLVATPGALATLDPLTIVAYVRRHVSGDWGELGPEDCETNSRAVTYGGRILSAYTVGEDEGAVRFWVITEADRSATTVLLPEEY